MIVVVADASPLIALQRIDQIGLLEALFEEVLIPQQWPENLLVPISLALEIRADRLIIDERAGRFDGGASITSGTEFWMNLQASHDLDVAQRASAEPIARDVRPIDS